MAALLVVGTAVYASSFPSRLLKFPLLAALGVVGKRLKKKTKTKKKKDNMINVFGEHDDDDDDDETPAVLRWSRVGLSVTQKKKTTTVKKVLENVSGEAMPGRVLAIVGPSGAGKTSLLNALAKRVPKKGAELTGRISMDNDFFVSTKTTTLTTSLSLSLSLNKKNTRDNNR